MVWSLTFLRRQELTSVRFLPVFFCFSCEALWFFPCQCSDALNACVCYQRTRFYLFMASRLRCFFLLFLFFHKFVFICSVLRRCDQGGSKKCFENVFLGKCQISCGKSTMFSLRSVIKSLFVFMVMSPFYVQTSSSMRKCWQNKKCASSFHFFWHIKRRVVVRVRTVAVCRNWIKKWWHHGNIRASWKKKHESQ